MHKFLIIPCVVLFIFTNIAVSRACAIHACVVLLCVQDHATEADEEKIGKVLGVQFVSFTFAQRGSDLFASRPSPPQWGGDFQSHRVINEERAPPPPQWGSDLVERRRWKRCTSACAG